MKIKVVHTLCGRESFVRQIVETGGHCPWDGQPFEKDYTAVLVEALEAAEEAGSVLENAFEKIASIEPAMTVDRDSILGVVEASVNQLNATGAPRR